MDVESIAITAILSYEETRREEVYTTGIFTFGFSDGIITKELGRCPGKGEKAMFNFTILSKYLVSRPFTYELDQVLVCSNKVKENRFLLSN